MLIYLVGFMGAGKTWALDHWKSDFDQGFDLDWLIAERCQIDKNELGLWITKFGLEKFRALETQILKETFECKKKTLVSLGGGAYHQENIKLINRNAPQSTAIWLKTSCETCWDRVKDDQNRPLVTKGKGAFFDLYKEREPLYKQAKLSISGENKLPSFKEVCNKFRSDDPE